VCGRCQGRSHWDFLNTFYEKVEDAEERATIMGTHLTEACRQLESSHRTIRQLEIDQEELKANLFDAQYQHRMSRELLENERRNHDDTQNQLSDERKYNDNMSLTVDYYVEQYRQAEKCHDIVSATAKQGLVIIDRQRDQITKLKATLALADATDIDTDTEEDMTDAGDMAETEHIIGLDFPEDNQPSRTIITER
jgi:hypothetical protein